MGTHQTRVYGCDEALDAYGALFGVLERKLFALHCAGESPASLKKDFIAGQGILARMFNSLKVSVEGKISASHQSRERRIASLERGISKGKSEIGEKGSQKGPFWVHQKKRRLANLKWKLDALKSDSVDGTVRIAFGSRRLWRRQFDLPANGYSSHEEWLRDWRDARSDEFFILGSGDENAGCQLCVASVADDGSLTLKLRMPDCLVREHGKYVLIEGVRFAYGHERILAALHACAEAKFLRKQEGSSGSELGRAISYRFKRDPKGWRVFVSTRYEGSPVVTDRHRGAFGVDVNADHLAVCETDPSGNPVASWSLPLVTYGKTTNQAEALVGDAVAKVIGLARVAGKPVVIERLDFEKKKAELEGESHRYSRMLSSFAYGKIQEYFASRGYREGVEVFRVNPAFSSLVGRVKFGKRYGLSVDQAAALVLARRLLRYSERVPFRQECSVGDGSITLCVPARTRIKHVWSHWSQVSRQFRLALAARHGRGQTHPVRAGKRGETSDEGLGADRFCVSGRDSRTVVALTVGATVGA